MADFKALITLPFEESKRLIAKGIAALQISGCVDNHR
jgi:hypothetical protein